MKLIFCKNCLDVVKLSFDVKFCSCKKCSGKYTDNLNAWYKGGDFVVPMGFANNSFLNALNNQPTNGMGADFSAFIIPKQCSTFKKIN